jgi:hypothetical protein
MFCSLTEIAPPRAWDCGIDGHLQRIGDDLMPRSFRSRKALAAFLEPRWLGLDHLTMEPHGVDSACLVGRLRSAPVMAAKFAKSSAQRSHPARAASPQASPVPSSSIHKLEDLGDCGRAHWKRSHKPSGNGQTRGRRQRQSLCQAEVQQRILNLLCMSEGHPAGRIADMRAKCP